jgi:hypothetical protein
LNGKRGVSEVLGYILLFGMVSIALTLVYIYAMPQIQSHQEYTSFKAMEDTISTIKTITELVAYNITPSKSINVRIENGILYVTNDINVTIETNPQNNPLNNTKLYALVYEIGNNKIILLVDTIFECFGNDCIVISRPRIMNLSGHAYLSFINISGSKALSGSGVLTFENNGSCVDSYTLNQVNLIFDAFDDDLARGLANALNRSLSDPNYSYKFTTQLNQKRLQINLPNTVVVSIHNVTVS